MATKQPQARPQNGTRPTTAGPAGTAATKPPSHPAGTPAPTPWQGILWSDNTKFIKKIFVGKFNGTDVERLGSYSLPRVEPTTLKSLAQICKEKKLPARHIIFDETTYVLTKKDPEPAEKEGFKLTFVGSILSRFPRLGHKIIYGFLTKEDYLILGFGPITKEASDAYGDETPRKIKLLISQLRDQGHLR